MVARLWLATLVTLSLFAGVPARGVAQREVQHLRDQVYISPTWGYEVRWHGDEWRREGEASAGGIDRLVLTDADQNVAGVVGLPFFAGDAVACLDDAIAWAEEALGATDFAVVRDEDDVAQEYADARRAWRLLLAKMPGDGGAVDHVLYFDCRTIVQGEAVLVRYVIARPNAIEQNLDHFDVLNVALPRVSWLPGDTWGAPLPLDATWSFKGAISGPPYILFAPDGTELGAITLVDADATTRVYVIENSGAGPLTIDPARFVLIAPPETANAAPAGAVAPASSVWIERGEVGPRILQRGERATLLLAYPDDLTDLAAAYELWRLVYRGDGLRDEYIHLECFDCAGGLSRPRLRLSR